MESCVAFRSGQGRGRIRPRYGYPCHDYSLNIFVFSIKSNFALVEGDSFRPTCKRAFYPPSTHLLRRVAIPRAMSLPPVATPLLILFIVVEPGGNWFPPRFALHRNRATGATSRPKKMLLGCVSSVARGRRNDQPLCRRERFKEAVRAGEQPHQVLGHAGLEEVAEQTQTRRSRDRQRRALL